MTASPEPTPTDVESRSGSDIRRVARIVLRVVVPIVAVAFIVSRVDFGELWAGLGDTNLLLVVVALVIFPGRFVFQVIRWRALLRHGVGATLRLGEATRLFWVGLGIGWFTPAALGSDVYRVASASRRLGRPAMNAVVVVVEKLLTLVACALLVVVTSLALPDVVDGRRDEVDRIVLFAAAGLVGLVVVVGLARLTIRTRVVRWIDRRLQRTVAGLLTRVRARTGIESLTIPDGGIRTALRPLARARVLGPALLLSAAVPVVAAISSQVMFQAVGYDISIRVNLFVAPLMFLVLALPISVGSIGVRESAFIILYGFFGVPADVALLVSLLHLVGLLTNIGVGAVIFAVGRTSRAALEPGPRTPSPPRRGAVGEKAE